MGPRVLGVEHQADGDGGHVLRQVLACQRTCSGARSAHRPRMKRESLPFRPSGLGFTSQSRAGQMSTLGPDVHTRAKIPPLRRPRANRPTSKLLRRTLLEVIEGQLAYPLPIVPGHEGAGIVEAVGPEARLVKPGDYAVCSWNPHCGHMFLLRSRPAHPVRAVHHTPAARTVARWRFAPPAERRAAASYDDGVRARRVLHRPGVRGDRRARRHSVRPCLPYRLRRHDRGRRGPQGG